MTAQPWTSSGWEAVYGTATRRMAAWLIDVIVLWISAALVPQAGGGTLAWSLWGAFVVLYEVVGVTLGGTPGKRLLGLRVVRLDGQPVRLSGAVVRELVRIASLLSFGFGFFWMLDNRRAQAWHDIAAETLVVRERRLDQGPPWRYDPPWAASSRSSLQPPVPQPAPPPAPPATGEGHAGPLATIDAEPLQPVEPADAPPTGSGEPGDDGDTPEDDEHPKFEY